MNKLYTDKGYISKALSSELLEKGVTLVTNVRKNMKAKAMSLWDRGDAVETLHHRNHQRPVKKHLSNRALHTPQRAWFYAEYWDSSPIN